MTQDSGSPAGPTRRQMLLGGAATAGTAWVAPSVVRVDRAAASAGSCAEVTIGWDSVTGSGPWTATATAGTVTITVTITATTTGTPNAYLSGGNLITSAGSGHSIGDTFDFSIAFSDTSGTICSATSRILDVDQNGRGLGCGTNSRFRDEILNLTGAGLTTVTEGGLAEVSPGVFASTLNCKTTDTENLAVTWAVDAGVTSGGYRWRLGTPPGTDPTLDFQLVKLVPFTVCTTSAAGVGGTRLGVSRSGPPLPDQD
ncbi:MAG: hypothetical protein AAF480_17070 [Actinomycetota bacterium]